MSSLHKMVKNLRGEMHKPASHLEQVKRRLERPARKAEEKKRKMAGKMKHAGYPDKFTSEKEQETRDPDYD